MSPRRRMPEPEPIGPFSDETEVEMSAIRRGLWLDDDQEVAAPRRASRAAAEGDEPEEMDLAEVDLQPRRASRALPAEDVQPEPEPVTEAPQAAPESAEQAGKQAEAKAPAQTKPAASTPASKPKAPVQELTPDQRRRRRWLVGVAAGAAASLALSFGVGALPPQDAPLPDTVPLVTAISRTCPVTDLAPGTLVAASSEGDIGVRIVGERRSTEQAGRLWLPDRTAPSVISPTLPQASVSGGHIVSTDTQLWWGTCRAPQADQYVQLPGGVDARLTIINPEPDDALVDVTLSGPEGEITGDGLRGLTVPGNSQIAVELSSHAQGTDALGARIRSSVGRVLAVGQVSRPTGGDFAAGTAQGTAVVIPALPSDPSSTKLLLTNPGTSRNVVKIEAVSEAGRYVLEGYEGYALDAQRTVSLDLTSLIAGSPMALVITARDSFAATAVVQVADDFAIEPGVLADDSVAAQDLVSVVPGPGLLQLANPGSGEVLAVINWGTGQAPANRTIGPGAIASIEIPAGAAQARVEATGPIAGALLLTVPDRSGIAVVVLHAAARPQASMPMEVDPVLGR